VRDAPLGQSRADRGEQLRLARRFDQRVARDQLDAAQPCCCGVREVDA
jgi:hypothetical protein